MIINRIESSPLKTKRFRAYTSDGNYYDFSLRGANTFLDHGDINKRDAYRKRHLGNPKEKQLIENLTMSPSLLSYYLTWGKYTDINKNIILLNNLLKK